MKIFWFDLETSGLDPVKNGWLTLAYKIEIDGVIVGEGKLWNNPVGKAIDDSALAINKLKKEDIAGFSSPISNYAVLENLFDSFVDRYDPADKFYAGGYNVGFDMGFLRQFFAEQGNKYFGAYFYFSFVDPSAVIPFLRREGMFPDFPVKAKLTDVARYFGVLDEAGAHDAEADISMTIAITKQLWSRILNVGADNKFLLKPEGKK